MVYGERKSTCVCRYKFNILNIIPGSFSILSWDWSYLDADSATLINSSEIFAYSPVHWCSSDGWVYKNLKEILFLICCCLCNGLWSIELNVTFNLHMNAWCLASEETLSISIKIFRVGGHIYICNCVWFRLLFNDDSSEMKKMTCCPQKVLILDLQEFATRLHFASLVLHKLLNITYEFKSRNLIPSVLQK